MDARELLLKIYKDRIMNVYSERRELTLASFDGYDMIEFAEKYHEERLALLNVIEPNGTLVCNCGDKPKDVPVDGYTYICNKCRKPFAN